MTRFRQNSSRLASIAILILAVLSTGCRHKVALQIPAAPVLFSCTLSPGSVFPGDPVTAVATVSGLPPSTAFGVLWSSTSALGFSGSGSTTSVSTTNLRPGQYEVQGIVADSAGHPIAGVPPCKASVVVKPFEPPTLAIATSAQTVFPSDTVTISLQGISPHNRPLTYSCFASIGKVSGSGATMTYSAAGVAPGTDVTITCNVVDDQGMSATAKAALSIASRPLAMPPPNVHSQSLCAISFAADKPPKTSVTPGAGGCLDDIALALARDPGARLAIVANATSAEGATIASARADNAFRYLVSRKGVDPGRLSRYEGSAGDQTAHFELIPGGAATPNLGTILQTPPADAQAGTPPTAPPPPPGPAVNPASSCTGYAVVAFPSSIDVSSPGLQPQSAFLMVGKTTPAGGIADSVRQTLCSTLALNASNCITATDWSAKTNACPAQTSLQATVPGMKQPFNVTIWMKSDGAMPLSVLATPALPSAIQPTLEGDGSPKTPLQIGAGPTTDSWSLTVNKDVAVSRDTALTGRMALKDATQANVFPAGDLLFPVNLKGPPEALSAWDKANNFIKGIGDNPLLRFLGISVSAIGLAIMAFLRKEAKLLWGIVTGRKAEPAVAAPVAAQAASPADPVAIAASPDPPKASGILVVHDNQSAAGNAVRPATPAHRPRTRDTHSRARAGDRDGTP